MCAREKETQTAFNTNKKRKTNRSKNNVNSSTNKGDLKKDIYLVHYNILAVSSDYFGALFHGSVWNQKGANIYHYLDASFKGLYELVRVNEANGFDIRHL